MKQKHHFTAAAEVTSPGSDVFTILAWKAFSQSVPNLSVKLEMNKYFSTCCYIRRVESVNMSAILPTEADYEVLTDLSQPPCFMLACNIQSPPPSTVESVFMRLTGVIPTLPKALLQYSATVKYCKSLRLTTNNIIYVSHNKIKI